MPFPCSGGLARAGRQSVCLLQCGHFRSAPTFLFTARTNPRSASHDSHAFGTAPARKSFSFMQTSTQYRAFADECRRLAQLGKTEQERKILEEMAAAWQSLAEEADRRRSRSGS
jgi:hypothetical protein